MDDIYEHYCELAKRYMNDEEDLDRCINTLTKLTEAKLNPLDSEIAKAAITRLKEQKDEVHRNWQKVYEEMSDLADCLAAAYDPNPQVPQENWIY